MSIEARLQVASGEYQRLQADFSNVVEAREQLDAQLIENEVVKKEFAVLKPANTVYKLIGPVLVKQDQVEAKANVDKRLEFIRGEIKRVEAQLTDLNGKMDKKKQDIIELQTELNAKSGPQKEPAVKALAAPVV